MVNCSKCGHEFLCDREKLISKKPFARAKKAISVSTPRDRREVIQSALMETGLIQLMCLCASLVIAAGCLWLFYNASSEMDGTSFLSMLQQPQQKAFALFFACLAGGLMACAGRRHKIVFILLGLLVAGGIASLPFVYPVKLNPSLLGGRENVSLPEEEDVSGFTSMGWEQVAGPTASVQNYGEGDLKPLFAAIDRKEDQGVLGVWVVGVNGANRDMVKAYLKRMTQSEDEPIFYDRKGTGGGLFVITPTPITFKEFVDVASKMGKVTLQDKERFFVEVVLNRDKFEARPASAALQDERHQYFVLANLKELSCLDIRRVIAAAKRLASVKPDRMRPEVSAKLVELLREPWGRDAEYVTALASALVVWGRPEDAEAQRVVYYVATELKKADCEIPASLVRFLLHGPEKKNFALLLDEWKKDPQKWEEECVAAGPTGEADIIRLMNESDDFVLKRSAARILGEIGSEASLSALKAFTRDTDNELRLCAELSVNLIEKRLGIDSSARSSQ